jgi:hypothetical protein
VVSEKKHFETFFPPIINKTTFFLVIFFLGERGVINFLF